MANAIGYCRITEEEAKDDKDFYILCQKHEIKEYGKKNGYKILECYVDEGFDSKEGNRPGLEQIISGELKNPPIECVIVSDSSIISTDYVLYFVICSLLKSYGIDLISVKNEWNQDIIDQGNVIQSAIQLAINLKNESQEYAMKDHPSLGRKKKAAQGQYSGGQAPYGYMVAGGKLLVIPEEAETVKYIYKCREDGMTLQKIIDSCYESGRMNRKGGKFSLSTIKSILDNKKTYEGYYHYKGLNGGETWVKGEQEPILSDES